MTIWFEPCVPDLGLRHAELVDAVAHDVHRAVEVLARQLAIRRGTAWSVTSRPPCRSRPSVGFWWRGDCRDGHQRHGDERRGKQPEDDV
jgi:hypothetical protein